MYLQILYRAVIPDTAGMRGPSLPIAPESQLCPTVAVVLHWAQLAIANTKRETPNENILKDMYVCNIYIYTLYTIRDSSA
jgi:hypothetical protein